MERGAKRGERAGRSPFGGGVTESIEYGGGNGDRRRGKSAVFERNARSPLTVKRRASTSGSRGSEQDFPRLNENRNIVCAETNETECGRRRPRTRLATAKRRQMQGSRENGKGQIVALPSTRQR